MEFVMKRYLVPLGLFMVLPFFAAAQAQPTVRTYFSPQLDGYLANACLSDGTSCGKPAADAWCRKNGWMTAMTFQRDRKPVTSRIVDSGELCSGPACTPFRQIKCYTPETASADAS
jgi:hypothetical protein